MWTNTVHVYRQYMYNHVYDNSAMYHEPRHELYYTGNTIIIELNSTVHVYKWHTRDKILWRSMLQNIN